MYRSLTAMAFGLALVLLPACGGMQAQQSEMSTLTGTVVYRERMMIPAGSEVVVRLEDVSKMDVAAELLGETRFVPAGGPPFEFSLQYNPERIVPRHRYAVRAAIYFGGRLQFTSTEHIDPFTGEQPVEVLVRRASVQK